jgi:hypothetical protein
MEGFINVTTDTSTATAEPTSTAAAIAPKKPVTIIS